MTITVNLKRMLDRKQWEMCNYAPANSGNGTFMVSSNLWDQYQYFIVNTTTVYCYDPFEDGWMQLPSPALGGTFGAGACGCRHPWGPRAFPSGTGTTTTVPTSLNLQRSLKGYTIRFIAGPNAGTEATIHGNTTGANSTITLEAPLSLAPTTASEFILMTGRLWLWNAGTTVSGSFKYYDLATNTWGTPSITSAPATWGTDGRMISTPGIVGSYATGTATSATTTTLVNSAKSWSTNNWANYQVRITAGTGAGQFRPIVSNTATTLTIGTAWTTTPDATSVYVIEGNDDVLYLMGNNSVALYRYNITANTWQTMAPTLARGGNAGGGLSGHFVNNVTNPDWNIESNCLNGNYIYSFRGSATQLDRYNISLNTWENDIAYTPKTENLNTGTSYALVNDYLYIMQTSPAGRLQKFNIGENRIEPCSQLWYAQSTIIAGDRMFDTNITDGTTTLRFLYFITHTQATMFRMMIF